jgi:hypothetical protein
MHGGEAGEPPAEAGADVAAPRRWSAGRTWAGRAIVLVAVAAVAVTLNADGGALTRSQVADTWQLLDIEVLGDDPLGSVWYLHTQPPGYNLLVAVVAWLPLPIMGGLYALDIAALAATGLLLAGILVRTGVGPIAAGAVSTVAILSPSLLSTIRLASYEVLAALLLVAAVAAAQRYLDEARTAWLIAAALALTAAGLTRSLIHPVWILAALGLLVAARRPSPRVAAAAFAVPVLLVGGWMLKNQVVFGTATTSSWLGFNLQRGIVGPMDAELVRDDVAAGEVTDLALVPPWGEADEYEAWMGDCSPHDHAVTAEPAKSQRGFTTTNFNYECYLPVYAEARDNAVTLVRRHPGEYLSDRGTALLLSFTWSTTRAGGETTWLDTVYDPLMLGIGHDVSLRGWNLPLFAGGGDLPITVSLTLAGLGAFVLGRGVLSAVRLVRRGWAGRAGPDGWPTYEVLWLLVSGTVVLVVLGGNLVEMGENTRFRAMIDPLLIGFPLGALALAVGRARAGSRERAGTPAAVDASAA